MMAHSPDAVLAFCAGVNVERNYALQPRAQAVVDADGKVHMSAPITVCNCWTTVYTAAMGCALPAVTANEQHDYLNGADGRLAGWAKVDKTTALMRASLGYCVVASWKNPTGSHGHIAPVVPSPPGDPMRLYVCAVGAENFNRARLERSFGAFAPDLYAHIPKGDARG